MDSQTDRRQSGAAPGGTIHVLVVVADPESASEMAGALKREGTEFEVRTALDAEAALSAIESHPIDAVVSAYRLSETDGIDLYEHIKEQEPTLPFVLFTDREETAVVEAALSAGVTDCLHQSIPRPVTRLAGRLRDAVARTRAEQELRTRQPRKRERLFRDLYENTQRCLSASSAAEVFEHVGEGVLGSLSLLEVTIFAFDDSSGQLEPATRVGRVSGPVTPISPGEDPIWEIFRTGETRSLDWTETDSARTVGVPIGDFGVVLARAPTIEPLDIELIELCVATAEAVLTRVRHESERAALAADLDGQQAHVEKIRGLLEVAQAILREVPESTRTDVAAQAVSELVTTEAVAFAWVGHPGGHDGALEPVAWAGGGSAYLDAIDPTDETDTCPAQQAGQDRSQITIDRIGEHVGDGRWAKEALSQGYRSVVAQPLLADGVLYGVLTVYSTEMAGLGQDCQQLIADVGSLLMTFYQLRNARPTDMTAGSVEFEFSIGTPMDPMTALAARTGATIRFDTLLETTETGVRILVSVDAAAETLPEVATEITAITEATWFDGPAQQLVLAIEGPTLAAGIRRHGGRLVSVTAETDQGRVVIAVPSDRPVRPLVEWLQGTYPELEMVARRETDTTAYDPPVRRLEDALTDRQLEILTAAYHGGYFDSPRTVSTGALGDRFGISDSAISKHLRSAIRAVLERLLVSESDN